MYYAVVFCFRNIFKRIKFLKFQKQVATNYKIEGRLYQLSVGLSFNCGFRRENIGSKSKILLHIFHVYTLYSKMNRSTTYTIDTLANFLKD